MIQSILMIALLGFVVYLVLAYIPMPPLFKTLIQVVAVVVVILWLVAAIGGGGLPSLRFR